MTDEMWKPIPTIHGFEVSNQGRVRNTEGRLWAIDRGRRPTDYSRVTLRGVRYSVHALVLMVFIGECPTGMVRNHKNGDKHDNRPQNLEYVTPSQNLQHAYDVLHRKGPEGEIHGQAKLNEPVVREIFKEHARGESARILAARFGVTRWTVFDICAGRSWRHLRLMA